MTGYWDELLTIMTIVWLGAMSPGPDWAIAMRNTLRLGRRGGLITAIGIALGVGVHATYCLLGIGALIASTPILFTALKWAGSLYLITLGVRGIISFRHPAAQPEEDSPAGEAPAGRGPFMEGLITNVLNPKATLFLLSVFSLAIDPHTPQWVRGIYGIGSVVTTLVWFTVLVTILSQPVLHRRLVAGQRWIDGILSTALVVLGFSILLT